MVEAVEHFDRALEHWGAGRPAGRAAQLGALALDIASLLTRLYVWPRQPSRVPDDRENDIIELMFRKATAIVSVDPRRYFAESLSTLRRINRFDITRVRQGAAIFATASAIFSVPGISLSLSRRILDYTTPFIDASDPKVLLYYRFSEALLDLLAGNWAAAAPYDPQLVEANSRLGEEWPWNVYMVVSATMLTERGHYAEAATLVETLDVLADAFDNDLILSAQTPVVDPPAVEAATARPGCGRGNPGSAGAAADRPSDAASLHVRFEGEHRVSRR